MESWQKGFELELLRGLTAPFCERHKPLVFGAFGLVKERDIADYLTRGGLESEGDPPQSVALYSVLRSGSAPHDFAQRKVVVGAGTLLVRAFAATSVSAGVSVLRRLHARGHPLVVEVFEEDSIARRCVAKLGLEYIATKIGTGSEIKGLYSDPRGVNGSALLPEPCLPKLPPEEEATLCVLRRNFLSRDQHEAILTELAGYDKYAQHYSSYNKRKSWTAFALRGYSDDPEFIIKPAEMALRWKEEHPDLMNAPARPTRVAGKFRHTMEVVEGLGFPLDRVRFMRLRSKNGELSRHADITDRTAGVQDGFVARLHIPIRTSNAVIFYGWASRGEKIEVSPPERSLMYLDQRKPHAVTNTDPELDRIHLVVDCLADAKLRALIARAYKREMSA